MAKQAMKAVEHKAEHKIEEFAEDLGRMLGSARSKAEGWLGQRTQITKHLEDIRDTASHLLTELGHEAQVAVRRGRSAVGLAKRGPGRPVGSGRKRRKMSAEARAKIAAAQRRRWAKVRAAQKK
jgi:ElaB/YqjD/DUF883 family membrane-anchored ribosome-binding protein